MEFIDFNWDEIGGTFVKEGLLGSDFTFSTKSELTHTVDYLPKNQARKLYTFAKELIDLLKNPMVASPDEAPLIESVTPTVEVIEEMETEEVTSFTEIMPVSQPVPDTEVEVEYSQSGKAMKDLTKDELFEKLQNYKNY